MTWEGHHIVAAVVLGGITLSAVACGQNETRGAEPALAEHRQAMVSQAELLWRRSDPDGPGCMPPDLTLQEVRQDHERAWFLIVYSRAEPSGAESSPANGEVVMSMLVNGQLGSTVILTGSVPRRGADPVWLSCPKTAFPQGELDLGFEI